MNQDEPVPGGWTDPAVYLRGGVFVAEEYHGNNQLVCLVAGESDPNRLAKTFNEDMEDHVSKNTGTKKSKSAKSAKNPKAKTAKSAKTPKTKKPRGARKPHPMLPGPGTILRKTYKGKEIEVRINGPKSFTYKGEQYDSFAKVVGEIVDWKVKKGAKKGEKILPNPYRFFKKQLEEKTAASA